MTMFILLLAACSGSNQANTEKEPESNNGNDTEEVAENEDEPEAEEEEETYDLGGRVIKIVDHYERAPQPGDQSYFGGIREQLFNDAEKKYNVKIQYEVVPFDEKVNQLTTTVLAGEPYADIIGLSAVHAGPLIEQDFLYALDEIIDLSESKMTDAMKEMAKIWR